LSTNYFSNESTESFSSNLDPPPVTRAYVHFTSLLAEPSSSWKVIQDQRGVTVAKMDIPGHPMGIVKGEGVFEGYGIMDLKAVIDCVGARRICE
jgi:hypothetical protein